jgi:hypothetical protein
MPFMEKLKKTKEEEQKKVFLEDNILNTIRELYIKRKMFEKKVHEINMKLDILIAMVKYNDNVKIEDEDIESINI